MNLIKLVVIFLGFIAIGLYGPVRAGDLSEMTDIKLIEKLKASVEEIRRLIRDDKALVRVIATQVTKELHTVEAIVQEIYQRLIKNFSQQTGVYENIEQVVKTILPLLSDKQRIDLIKLLRTVPGPVAQRLIGYMNEYMSQELTGVNPTDAHKLISAIMRMNTTEALELAMHNLTSVTRYQIFRDGMLAIRSTPETPQAAVLQIFRELYGRLFVPLLHDVNITLGSEEPSTSHDLPTPTVQPVRKPLPSVPPVRKQALPVPTPPIQTTRERPRYGEQRMALPFSRSIIETIWYLQSDIMHYRLRAFDSLIMLLAQGADPNTSESFPGVEYHVPLEAVIRMRGLVMVERRALVQLLLDFGANPVLPDGRNIFDIIEEERKAAQERHKEKEEKYKDFQRFGINRPGYPSGPHDPGPFLSEVWDQLRDMIQADINARNPGMLRRGWRTFTGYDYALDVALRRTVRVLLIGHARLAVGEHALVWPASGGPEEADKHFLERDLKEIESLLQRGANPSTVLYTPSGQTTLRDYVEGLAHDGNYIAQRIMNVFLERSVRGHHPAYLGTPTSK